MCAGDRTVVLKLAVGDELLNVIYVYSPQIRLRLNVIDLCLIMF